MAAEDIFRTTRMALLRGASPTFLAGEHAFLQRDVQGFPKGTKVKIVSVHSARPGEHRYHLVIGNEKIWAFEADLRPTAPGAAPLATGPQGELSITQKLQSMSLSQRMATLGVDETRRLADLAATQRMHALTPAQRISELLRTNRVKALASGAASPAAGSDGTGEALPPLTDATPAKPPRED